jgi:hypothetical protein
MALARITGLHQTIGGLISLACSVPLAFMALFATFTFLGWGYALKAKLTPDHHVQAQQQVAPVVASPAAASGDPLAKSTSRGGMVKMTRTGSLSKSQGAKAKPDAKSSSPQEEHNLNFRQSVVDEGDESENSKEEKKKQGATAMEGVVVEVDDQTNKGTFGRSSTNAAKPLDSSSQGKNRSGSSAATAKASSAATPNRKRASTVGEAAKKLRSATQNQKNLRLFRLMYTNLVCATLCAAFDAWKKLADYTVEDDPRNEFYCHSACKVYVFFYILAKLATYSFLGYKVLIVWEVRGDKSFFKMVKAFIAVGVLMGAYAIVVTYYSYGIVFKDDCIYRVQNAAVLFIWPVLDVLITGVLLFYFLKPIWESKQRFDSPRYRNLIRDNVISGGIAVVCTQVVLMIVVPFSVVSGTVSNLTGSLVSFELLVNGICQLASVRKSWVRVACVSSSSSKKSLNSMKTAGMSEDPKSMGSSGKGFMLTGGKSKLPSVDVVGKPLETELAPSPVATM